MADKLVLYYIGTDYWSRPVYKSPMGRLFKDTNLGDPPLSLTTVCGGFEGEPDTPLEFTVYKDDEIVIIDEPSKENKFNYMMLDRLRMDCDYYLGYGNRNKKQLYYGDEQQIIDRMKELWNGFPDDAKPEFLTYETILDYEKRMINP